MPEADGRRALGERTCLTVVVRRLDGQDGDRGVGCHQGHLLQA